jgi:hypothetical protein
MSVGSTRERKYHSVAISNLFFANRPEPEPLVLRPGIDRDPNRAWFAPSAVTIDVRRLYP